MIKNAVSNRGLYALSLTLVLTAVSARGANYYVSTTGSDANSGTSSQPFRTIAHAYSLAAAGTTIYVAPGIYTEYASGWGIHLAKSGTASSPIVLKSQVLHGAIIDRQNASDGHEGFYIDGSYNVLDGFEILNAPDGGVTIYGNGNQILNNHIHNNGNPASTSTNGKDGVYSDQNTSGTVYSGNWIDHNGRTGSNLDHGLYLCGKNEIICNNVLLANASRGLQIAGYSTVSNMKVYNNVFAFNGVDGIVLWMALSGIEIKNNIFYGNANYGIGSYQATGSGVVVNNNISFGNAAGDFSFSGGSSTYTYSQAANLFSNPQLVNATSSAFDPHLAAGSPAILAGLNLSSTLTTDMAGAPRPASGAWDLGVYVFASSSPASVTVAATTPTASRVTPSSGIFAISRSGPTTSALTVNCLMGGAAVNGADYASLGASLTIPAGAVSATVTITPLPSASFVGSKSVVLSLAPGSGYSTGSSSNATVSIGGNGLPSSIARAPSNNSKITWSSVVGKVYRVASKNNLSDAAWSDLSSPLTASSASTSYTDAAASTRSQRFYLVYLAD